MSEELKKVSKNYNKQFLKLTFKLCLWIAIPVFLGLIIGDYLDKEVFLEKNNKYLLISMIVSFFITIFGLLYNLKKSNSIN